MHSTPGPRLGTPSAAEDATPELDVAHGRLLELLPSAVLVIELDGRITFANAEAERLFGMTRERLSSVGIDDLVPEQLRERYRELRRKFVGEADPEFRVLRGERVMKPPARLVARHRRPAAARQPDRARSDRSDPIYDLVAKPLSAQALAAAVGAALGRG